MIDVRQRFPRLFSAVAIGLLACILPGDIAAARGYAAFDETGTLWGLRPRDRFIVNLTIVKQTEVTIGDQAPVTSDTRDQLEIEYTIAQILNADDAMIVARVLSATRESGKTSSGSVQSTAAAVQMLEDATIVFHVDAEGQVSRINPSDRDAIFAGLSNMDTTTSGLLQDACPDEVIGAWFGRVFWIAASQEKIRTGAAWKSPDNIALGAFGTLRATAELTPGKSAGGFNLIAIKGSGEFVPLVVPEVRASRRPSILKDFSIELDEYSGKARVLAETTTGDDLPAIQDRSAFGSMDITYRIHGQGVSTASNPQPVAFRQTQIQTWILTKPMPGLGNFQFDIPIPDDAPPMIERR